MYQRTLEIKIDMYSLAIIQNTHMTLGYYEEFHHWEFMHPLVLP